MDSNQLKSFISISRTLNFTEAAKLNYLTQSAISRQMKELEDSLGVKLFYRTKHSVTLTEEGKAFLRYAEDQLENEREIRTVLQTISQGNVGMIRIALLPDMAYEVTRCLEEFNSRYPTIQFTIDQAPGTRFGEMLLEKQHHFYFGTTSSFVRTHGFQYLKTHDERFVLVAHKKLTEKIDTSDISTFAKMPFAFISHDAGPIYYDSIFAFCERIGYTPLIMSYFNTGESVMLAVNAGIGISIMTETTARISRLENVEILPFEQDHLALTGAIGWKSDHLNDSSRKFLDVIDYFYPADKHPIQQS